MHTPEASLSSFQGGVPDLEGSAVSVLRDWNSGKIAYYSVPPAIHPSSMPQAEPPTSSDDVAMDSNQVGDAKILNTLSEAFTLDGLFRSSHGRSGVGGWRG